MVRCKKAITLLAGLILLGVFSCSDRNRTDGYGLFDDAWFPVLKPPAVFQENATFREEFLHYIELEETRNFQWRISRDLPEGTLIFSVFWSGFVNRPGPGKTPGIRIGVKVTREREGKVLPLLEKVFKPEVLRHRVGTRRRYFSKRIRQDLALRKGDILRFFLHDCAGGERDDRWGITIPAVEKRNAPREYHSPPNVIIISIDTLRADALGIYRELLQRESATGYSPNLDKLAKEATVFTRAFTTLSATWPALSSLMLSLYPNEHGCYHNGDFLDFDFYSLASYLLDKGYHTLSLNSNAFGLNIAGFERKKLFYDDPDLSARSYRNCDEKLVAKALARLKRSAGAPFFHWYHFMGTHDPYVPPRWILEEISEGREIPYYNLGEMIQEGRVFDHASLEDIRTLYHGELFHLDKEIQKILDFLKSHDLYENTLLVVTSDHGEDLYQHHRYFYHYPSLYNSGIHIPLLIKFPHQSRQVICSTPVSILDVFPTLCHFFEGQEYRNGTGGISFSGLSLIPLLRGDTRSHRNRVIFSGVENFQIMSARYGDWNLIYNPGGLQPVTRQGQPYPYRRVELYNFSEDYGDRAMVENNRIEGFLIGRIQRFLQSAELQKYEGIVQKSRISDETRKEAIRRLKALGYIN